MVPRAAGKPSTAVLFTAPNSVTSILSVLRSRVKARIPPTRTGDPDPLVLMYTSPFLPAYLVAMSRLLWKRPTRVQGQPGRLPRERRMYRAPRVHAPAGHIEGASRRR